MLYRGLLLLVSIILSCHACTDITCSKPPTVTTPVGKIEGFMRSNVRTFLGIPYASSERFQHPKEAKAWEGVLKAKEFGPSCYQNSNLYAGGKISNKAGMSEDCLSLNVFAPPIEDSDELLPTYVFIHGGSFISGGSNEILLKGIGNVYNGATIAKKGVCSVTINYRLGPLGFMAHSTFNEANFGFADQIAALKWIQQNIESFGCDPNQVTVGGESAGSMSTFLHVVSPASASLGAGPIFKQKNSQPDNVEDESEVKNDQPLFQRTIMESGTYIAISYPSFNESIIQGDILANEIGCVTTTSKPEDVHNCLLAADPQDITSSLPHRTGVIFGDGALWLPIIDNHEGIANPLIPEDPLEIIKDTDNYNVNGESMLVGFNDDEGSLFVITAFGLTKKFSNDEYMATVDETFKPFYPDDDRKNMLEMYPSVNYKNSEGALAAGFSDGLFICPTREFVRDISTYRSDMNIFAYDFKHTIKLIKNIPFVKNLGVFHASELPYIFDGPYPLYPHIFTKSERAMGSKMLTYWTNFMSTGDVNTPSIANLDELLENDQVSWPLYTTSEQGGISEQVMEINEDFTVGTFPRANECEFWDSTNGSWPPIPPPIYPDDDSQGPYTPFDRPNMYEDTEFTRKTVFASGQGEQELLEELEKYINY